MSAIQHLITEHLDIWTAADTGPKSGRGRSSANAAKVYGISKLRELILELAVRGKLVPQDASDEPAIELLKRIQAEKAKLVAEGKIKKDKLLPPIAEEQIPFMLPRGWEWIRISEISELITSGSRDWAKYLSDDGAIFVTMGNLSRGNYALRLDNMRYVNPPKAGEGSRTRLEAHDLLISITGDVGNLGRIPEGFGEAYINQHTCLLRFLPLCRNRYFPEVLRSPIAVSQFNAPQRGVKNSFRLGDIDGIKIPLPPLAEQHRIVAKVDELMALCDQLEAEHNNATEAHEKLVCHLLDTLTQSQSAEDFSANWQRIAAHFDALFTTEASIDALKQTLLQLAVMGKLVPQDPNDEPASELLKHIQAEKAKLIAEGKIKKDKTLAAITKDEKPFELPAGWEWSRLGDVTSGMDSGWSPACLENSSPSNDVWGVLKTTSVQVMQYLEYENKELPGNLKPRPDAEVKIGDILFTRAGPMNRVGVSCLVQSTRPRLMISDKIIRFHPMDIGIYGRFIALCLNAGATADYLEKAKSGMAASQVNITQDKLRFAPVPIAPQEEQHRIVAKVDELMALCDQLKSRLTEASQLQQKLANVLVGNAVSTNVQPAHTGNADAKLDQAAARTLLATEVVHQLNTETRMGRVKLQKVVNLAEYVAGLKEVASEPLRNAAGPHDRHFMDQVLQGMKDRQWYEEQPVDGGNSYRYRPLARAGQHRADYEALWSPEQRRKISDLIALMRSWKTDQCERVATLYSAWNDLLIEGKEATEANILNEVLNRWNNSKLDYTKAQWQTELAAMKMHALLIPTGFGRRTTGGTQTLLLH